MSIFDWGIAFFIKLNNRIRWRWKADGIIKIKDDEVEFMEEAEDLDEGELNSEMEGLIVLANDFYDREMERYEKE